MKVFSLKTLLGFFHNLLLAPILAALSPPLVTLVESYTCPVSCASLMGEASGESHPWPVKSHAPSTAWQPTSQQGSKNQIQMVCHFHML